MGRSLAYDAIFVRGAGVALPLLLLALATASIGLGIKPALAKPAGRRRLAVDAAAFAWLARALAAVTCYDLAARAYPDLAAAFHLDACSRARVALAWKDNAAFKSAYV